MAVFDLNCDLGESFGVWGLGDDDALLEMVTSANVACGFYAGGPTTMRRVCGRAAELEVAVGAQVGYLDLVGFGRRRIDMDPEELADEVLYQLGALDAIARAEGTHVSYLKPHGALYHAVVDDLSQAEAVVSAVHEFDPRLAVLGLPGSQLLDAAASLGLRGVPEAFADRAYLPTGGLVPRGARGAALDDETAVVERALGLAMRGQVTATDGSTIDVSAASICVHGDTPGAATLARAVRDGLERAGVTLAPFAG